MDLHPIFVHFPIALLTLYSFLEMIRRFTGAPYWVQVRGVLIIAGVLGAYASLFTGEVAARLYATPEFRNVLEAHSLLADVSTWIFTVLAASYAIVWLQNSHRSPTQKTIGAAEKISRAILETPATYVLVILGFTGLTLTGTLGAILVYGPDFDPITSLVYDMFFRQ